MSIKRKDSNGVYRKVDSVTGEFIEDYPLTHNLGQMEHQTVATAMGNVTDPDEIRSDVVDEYGVAVIEEDEIKLKQYVKGAISVDNLVETFNDNSHETLLKLLALQDNKNPLKKGGIGIAYRTDALIMHCKMEFTADENIVFDAILGTMSSFPENKTYKIEPADFKKFAKYADDKYLYSVFRKGTGKLSDRHLVFDGLGPDGEDSIKVPWFNILRYHNPKKGENAYIEFAPSDFFKDLALCSQLVHGAYGAIEVTTQLQGKYTIALYWFLENKKNYREYPGAQPGFFRLSNEEIKHQFSIPESYKKADIERRVLVPARDSINSVEECDFTFEYDNVYVRGKHAGFEFTIKQKNYIESTATEILEIETKEIDPLQEQVSSMLSVTGINFNEDDKVKIYQCVKRNNKNAMDLMPILPVLKSRIDNKELDSIDNVVAYLCRMIQDGVTAPQQSGDKETKKSKNNFNNFQQRDYNGVDWDDLLFNKK
ncbi:Initiator Replication protein [Pseudobutyrivibrio sp. 49]|uniref:replication initiation protein n=1 Tax=Pseudobutyrivibrio sp. 49 TaxID=1855344 RepID=UPI000888A96C|nr:replication initiation protein [Pseudobutyrivibrio sp. 49]SDI56123.1 Initiator Replication protein [Pseudobutyrivibrio sp. 49]